MLLLTQGALDKVTTNIRRPIKRWLYTVAQTWRFMLSFDSCEQTRVLMQRIREWWDNIACNEGPIDFGTFKVSCTRFSAISWCWYPAGISYWCFIQIWRRQSTIPKINCSGHIIYEWLNWLVVLKLEPFTPHQRNRVGNLVQTRGWETFLCQMVVYLNHTAWVGKDMRYDCGWVSYSKYSPIQLQSFKICNEMSAVFLWGMQDKK